MEEALNIPTMAECQATGKLPEVLFWVGCAGSFDDRAKKITKAFAKLLQASGVSFAVLGAEESCTGDPAKRSGNEFLFQMQAMMNIQVLNGYGVGQIVTTCPHCFNTLKNEYPDLGGNYQVMHHTQFLKQLLDTGRLKVSGGSFRGKKITYHDPCYLGRANGEYQAPRALLERLELELIEMKRCKSKGLCCGAGGAQMFKEEEPGDKKLNVERVEELLESNPDIIAVNCPYCTLMMDDGLKNKEKDEDVMVYDISELIVQANKW